jgi:choline-sulfatase
VLTTLLPLLLACSSPEPAPEPGRPNLLVIDIDSLRADRIDAQRDGAPVAPNIQALAQRGVRFDGAVAQAAWTLPSLASLLTGRLPPAMEQRAEGLGWLDEGTRTLPETLGLYGYRSQVWYGQTLPASFTELSRGFDTVDMAPPSPPNAYHQQVCAWLEATPPQPFLALVHNFDLHAPRHPAPAGFMERWLGRAPVDDANSLDAMHRELAQAEGEQAARAYVIDAYDGHLAWYDQTVGSVLRCLDRAGLAEDTVVVLTSDHGEDLFEHGTLGHGQAHWQSVLAVPLLVLDGRHPERSHRVEARVQTVDLAPTLLELAGIPVDQRMEGRSLLPLLEDPAAPWPERDVVGFSSLRAASLIRGPHKLALHVPPPGTEPKGPTPELGPMAPGSVAAFWDLAADPGEQRDLAPERPPPMAAMQADLLSWVELLQARSRGGTGVATPPELERALREGGYWEHVEP